MMYSWELTNPGGASCPPTRGRHTAVLDDTHHHVVIFGGQNFDLRVKYNTIAKFDLGSRQWESNPNGGLEMATAPSPRSSHASVFYDGALYVFGGTTSLGLPHQCNKDNGVWRYDLTSDVWGDVKFNDLDICGKRYGHTTVCLPKGIVILYGGMTDAGPEGATYEFDLVKRTVTKIITYVAEPGICVKCGGTEDPVEGTYHPCKTLEVLSTGLHLYGHTSVYHKGTHSMLVFGGTGKAAIYSQIFAQLDLTTKVWTLVPSVNAPPEGRYVHCAAIDNDDTMYIFGGFSGQYRRDLHAYHIHSACWREFVVPGDAPCPSLRSGASVVIDSRTDSLYVFGGCDDETYFNDVWRLRVGNTKSLLEIVAEWVRDAASDDTTSMTTEVFPTAIQDVIRDVTQRKMMWK